MDLFYVDMELFTNIYTIMGIITTFVSLIASLVVTVKLCRRYGYANFGGYLSISSRPARWALGMKRFIDDLVLISKY